MLVSFYSCCRCAGERLLQLCCFESSLPANSSFYGILKMAESVASSLEEGRAAFFEVNNKASRG
jgi:hypothetical protein